MDQERPTGDRRIGSRLDIDPVEIRWILPEQRKGRFRRKRPVDLGRMVNISITGAAIEAASDLPARLGAVVGIFVNERQATVRIRQTKPTDQPDVMVYGVEFIELSARLKDEIYGLLGSGRPTEDSWLRAK